MGRGVSDAFSLQSWQKAADVPNSVNTGRRKGRGLPDLASDADTLTNCQAEVDDSNAVIGSLSAVAPLQAGLIALFNQALSSPGRYLNPGLHKKQALPLRTFRDVTRGNNSAYKALPGWEACIGWGSLFGSAILSALSPPKDHKLLSQDLGATIDSCIRKQSGPAEYFKPVGRERGHVSQEPVAPVKKSGWA